MRKTRKMIIVRDIIGSRRADSDKKALLVVKAIDDASKTYSALGIDFYGLNKVSSDFLVPIMQKRTETEDCEIYLCNLKIEDQSLVRGL